MVWSQWFGVWYSKFEPLRLRLKFLQYVLGVECDDERKDLHIGHIMSLQTDSRAGHLMLYIQWLLRWGGGTSPSGRTPQFCYRGWFRLSRDELYSSLGFLEFSTSRPMSAVCILRRDELEMAIVVAWPREVFILLDRSILCANIGHRLAAACRRRQCGCCIISHTQCARKQA